MGDSGLMKVLFILLVAFLNLASSNIGYGQSSSDDDPRVVTLALMYYSSKKAKTADELREMMRFVFFDRDFDGGGISSRDRELVRTRNIALNVARRMGSVFGNDLDRDGIVTPPELRLGLLKSARESAKYEARPHLPTEEQIEAELENQISEYLKRDLNRDGLIPLDEAFREAKAYFENRFTAESWASPMPTPTFDLDGDQTVSSAEFDVAVDKIIVEFDSDGDGVFSEDESVLLHRAAIASKLRLERRD